MTMYRRESHNINVCIRRASVSLSVCVYALGIVVSLPWLPKGDLFIDRFLHVHVRRCVTREREREREGREREREGRGREVGWEYLLVQLVLSSLFHMSLHFPFLPRSSSLGTASLATRDQLRRLTELEPQLGTSWRSLET